MRIIALVLAFVLTGCNGDRLKTETKPTAVALSTPPVAAAFAAILHRSPRSNAEASGRGAGVL